MVIFSSFDVIRGYFELFWWYVNANLALNSTDLGFFFVA